MFTDPRFTAIAGATEHHIDVGLPFQRFASYLIGHPMVYLKIVRGTTKLALAASSFNNRIPRFLWHLYPSCFACLDTKSQGVCGHTLPRNVFLHCGDQRKSKLSDISCRPRRVIVAKSLQFFGSDLAVLGDGV